MNAKGHSIKITLIYALTGVLWILLSDRLVALLFTDHETIIFVSIIKGWVYVLVTAVLIFLLTYPSFKTIIDKNNKINAVNSELEKEQVMLKSLLDSIPDQIFYKNPDSVFIECNRAFAEVIGKPVDEIIGRSDFEIFDQNLAVLYRKVDLDVLNNKLNMTREHQFLHADGQYVHLETLLSPFYDHHGNAIGIIGISRDISERKKKEAEILYLYYHDVLTGLSNRAFFRQEQARLDQEANLPLSVIVGDINGLKLINDALGHAEGDNLLTEMAKILQDCCRPSDVLARTGGDEFSILLPNTTSVQAQLIVDSIKTTCENHMNAADSMVYYSNISLGYATKSLLHQSLEKIIKTAEELMYKRKLLEHKSLHSSIISSIKRTMFEKSNETEEHAERLGDLSKKLGQAIGLSSEDQDTLELFSTLHDIGKISIEQSILSKNGPLSDDEWIEIRRHPEVGYRITQASPELSHISDYILCHHERWDGKGYPQGLSGEDIPVLSRILSIVDSYDAMTQDRSYRKAMTHEDAVAEIIRNAGKQFDPRIAKIFVENVLAC